ncbi:MAG: GAF domain-containing sensor histidine kinase [Actinomycetota bacterium]|nr:GAF domain-containing sensor histidine kinase [Actinomycetota bacterium]
MEAVPSVPSAPALTAAPLASLGAGVRWGTLGLGLVLAALSGQTTLIVGAWALALAGMALWQSDESVGRERRPTMVGGAEVALDVAAVVTTGGWSSPFVFCLLGGIIIIGFDRGFATGIRAAVAATAAVALPYHFNVDVLKGDSLRLTGQWAVELLLVAILAGYARRLFGQAQEQHSLALTRMSQLTEANELLVSLHRVAQTLPASLDLDQVLASTINRLRSLIDCDLVAVLLHDEATDTWTVAASEGAVLPPSFSGAELPRPLAAATTSSVASLVVSLGPGEGLGPDVLSRSGLYAPLRARGMLLGLIALEQHEPGFYGRRDLQILDGFLEPAALAMDNARWFSRLRTIGADEERVRIARDMHDSVGQSLAFVAFKLDRLAAMAADEKLGEELNVLRNEVRGVLAEVRDTLCDLRTEVTEDHGLVDTLEEYLERVEGRADFEVSFWPDETARLPVVQERELWRVAQEAVTNVERHAGARHLRVRWECDGRRGRLTVADDGRGFAPGDAIGFGSYGIRGMRERANAIGGELEIDSEPFVGTVIECRVEAQ